MESVAEKRIGIQRGDGVFLVGGEAFVWRPWQGAEAGKNSMVNQKGQFEVPEHAWGILDLVWPRPGMFIAFVLSFGYGSGCIIA